MHAHEHTGVLLLPRAADGRCGDTLLEVTYAPDLCVAIGGRATPLATSFYTMGTDAGDCVESQIVQARDLAGLADHPDVQGSLLNRAAWAYLQALPPDTEIGLCWLWPVCWWLPGIKHCAVASGIRG